jgi:hypothetical protein
MDGVLPRLSWTAFHPPRVSLQTELGFFSVMDLLYRGGFVERGLNGGNTGGRPVKRVNFSV